MARQFSIEEAKDVVARHKELHSSYQKALDSIETIRKEAVDVLNEYIRSGNLLSYAKGELCEGNEINLVDNQLERVLLHLWKYKECNIENQTDCISLITGKQSAINNALSNIQIGLGGLKWVFSGRLKRENANIAYQVLQESLHSDYSRNIEDLANLVKMVENGKPLDLRSDFERFREDYKSAVTQLRSSLHHTNRELPEILSLKGKIKLLKEKEQSIQDVLTKQKREVLDAADDYRKKACVALLREASIDELNRDKRGIRLFSLREHGYNTVADIYYATLNNLESITGISSDTAYLLKRRADEYAAAVASEIVIRINTDDRDLRTSNLVEVLYPYRRQLDNLKQYQEIKKSKLALQDHAESLVNQFDDALSWLFFQTEEKQPIIEAFRYLEQALDESTISEICRLERESHLGKASYDDAWNDFAENSISYYTALEEAVPGALGENSLDYGLPAELAKEIEEECFFPDGLKCSLRRYQEWGVKYALHQGRALIGDEMGLGKTIQAIAVMVSLKNTGASHFIVVCPASVLTNWCKEISEKSKLRVTRVHGSDRKQSIQQWIAIGGVAVTTYETTTHFHLEPSFMFSLLVVDEAHYVKNPDAQRTINVRRLASNADRILFMTGTALENKVSEMIALISMLQPKVADSVRNFQSLASASRFRKLVSPVYFRRKREQVLNELPELIETKEWCELSSIEEEIYEESVLSKNYAAVRQVSWNAPDIYDSCKAKRLLELVEEAKDEGRKVLVFSFFLDTISKVCNLLGNQCMDPINGSVPPQKRQAIIDAFEKAPAGQVLPAQIQSGGTGLNIQAASVVILCEPQFKPSIENQAISRAYRMGQARNVLVYRLLCLNTVDERITELLSEKQHIFNEFADKSTAGENSLELSEKNFGDIIKEEIARINAKHNGMNDGVRENRARADDIKITKPEINKSFIRKTTYSEPIKGEPVKSKQIISKTQKENADALDLFEEAFIETTSREENLNLMHTIMPSYQVTSDYRDSHIQDTRMSSINSAGIEGHRSIVRRTRVTKPAIEKALEPFIQEIGGWKYILENEVDEAQDVLTGYFSDVGCAIEGPEDSERLTIYRMVSGKMKELTWYPIK